MSKKREEAQKERDTFREQITMDVSEKVTTVVKDVVANTAKEIILESMHGSPYHMSPSPMNLHSPMYGVAHLSAPQPGSPITTSKQRQRYNSNSNPMRYSAPAPQTHLGLHQPSNSTNHLSPNYHHSSTRPMSSPNQKASIDSDEIYNNPDDSGMIFTTKSPYTVSNAVLSPNRHNSYRDSNSKSPNTQQNMQYMIYDMNNTQTNQIYEDSNNIPDIPSEHRNSDNASVNYDDAEMDEKEFRKSSHLSRKISGKTYGHGYTQPDVFPDDEDEEGAETQVIKEGYDETIVAYDHAEQEDLLNNYNSSSEQDKEEKVTQNDATIGGVIEMQNRYVRKRTNSSKRTSSYGAPIPANASQARAAYDRHSHPNMYHQIASNTNTITNNMSHSRYIEDAQYDQRKQMMEQHYYMANNANDNSGSDTIHSREEMQVHSYQKSGNLNEEEYWKTMEKIMLDKDSSVGDMEELNDRVPPLRADHHLHQEMGKYKQQMQYGRQLSPIITNKRPSASEQSESHRSGKSFLTLNDERKQIEVSNDDGLDDDLDDDLDDIDDQHVHSPLLSRESGSGSDNELREDTSTCTDEDQFEEFDKANAQYKEYIQKRKKGKKVSVHSQSFDVEIQAKVVENPFKIVDSQREHSSFSATNITHKNESARNEDESLDYNEASQTMSGGVDFENIKGYIRD